MLGAVFATTGDAVAAPARAAPVPGHPLRKLCRAFELLPDDAKAKLSAADRAALTSCDPAAHAATMRRLKDAITDVGCKKVRTVAAKTGAAMGAGAMTGAFNEARNACSAPSPAMLRDSAEKVAQARIALVPGPAIAPALHADQVGGEQAMLAVAVANEATAPMTTGSFESTAISALATVLASRANAELQAYGIEVIKDLACSAKRKPWLPSTCAFVDADSAELPISFGVGLRTALIQDVKAFPKHAIDTVTMKGSTDQLLATLFVGSIKLLGESSDLYQVAQLMVRMSQAGTPDTFTCDPAIGGNCPSVLTTIGQAGSLLTGLLGDPDQLDTMPDNDLKRDVLAARLAAEAFADASGDARRDQVKPLIAAIEIAVNQALQVAGTPARLPDGLPALGDAIAHGDIAAMVTSALSLLPQLFPGPALDPYKPVLRLMSFAAELDQAKTSDDMKAAIESVIAPIASYRLKNTKTMFSITALVGGAAGWEGLTGGQLGGRNRYSPVFAPSAFVGFDFTTPWRALRSNVGLFVSVIDLGSLMSYRLSTDPVTVNQGTGETTAKVGQTSNVGFNQVFAPGAMLRMGLGGSPFVLGAGVDWVPDARTATPTSGGPNVQLSAFRVFASLSIDVTLFPFHF
ncbi:MAG TPA: hypothetical protein VFP84_15510 [Kofleriaceae bacterium]|nr:hypothetical protein [Kofleriaceae bacterium]